jgi:hypothetical protein
VGVNVREPDPRADTPSTEQASEDNAAVTAQDHDESTLGQA